MPLRIVYVDASLCTGCGVCVPACTRGGLKRALATEQVRSVYLERLIERAEARGAT